MVENTTGQILGDAGDFIFMRAQRTFNGPIDTVTIQYRETQFVFE